MKDNHTKDTPDNEILYEEVSREGVREVLTDRAPQRGDRKRQWRQAGWVSFAIVALLGAGMVFFWPDTPMQDDVQGVFESSYETNAVKALGTEETVSPYAESLDTLVNGHLIHLFIPHHATPRLYVGTLDDDARRSVLGFQAADVRADNWEILGEFVLAGEQLSRGVSKKGFCAIIDGKVTLGAGEKTPLLAEAVSRGGYFFRQYPLVIGGSPLENKPKNRTIRRALCERGGQVFVAVSGGELTFADFSRALADLAVDNAIYLIGGEGAHGWTVDADGVREEFSSEDLRPEYRNESYIIWE